VNVRRWIEPLSVAAVLALAACPNAVDPEPIGDAQRPHFNPVDAGLDAAQADARRSDARADAAQPVDSATRDVSHGDAGRTDVRTNRDAAGDAGSDAAYDAAHDAGNDAAHDAGGDASADAASDDGGLPLLRIEVDQEAGSDELYVDWTNPAGAKCEDWCNPKTCDWGVYGVATIADDDCGNASTNWVEISNARVATGMYKAKVYGVFCDYFCAADEIRIYVAGTLIKRFVGSVDISWDQFLCMPVTNGAWDTANFNWPRSSCP